MPFFAVPCPTLQAAFWVLEVIVDNSQTNGNWHENDSGGIGAPLYELPGIYAIYFNDVVIYIGQSDNVQRRLLSHLDVISVKICSCRWVINWKHCQLISEGYMYPLHYKWCHEPNAQSRIIRERDMIKRLKPFVNIQHNKGGEI
jgi:hypothetical protein